MAPIRPISKPSLLQIAFDVNIYDCQFMHIFSTPMIVQFVFVVDECSFQNETCFLKIVLTNILSYGRAICSRLPRGYCHDYSFQQSKLFLKALFGVFIYVGLYSFLTYFLRPLHIKCYQ